MRTLRITSVEVYTIRGERPQPPDGPLQRNNSPLGIYPEHRAPLRTERAPETPGQVQTSMYIRIATDGGVDGFYGPIDPETPPLIVHDLAALLIGQDALASTIIWDKMEAFDRHSRHGQRKMAISAVDNALWDLRGKAYDAPVWQLLGGASRERIPAYVSTLGTSLEPEIVAEVAAWAVTEGFAGQKWFFSDGPGSGPEGLRRNVDLVAQVRESAGEAQQIFFDASRGWDLMFARRWVERVADYHPDWLEEPFHPGQFTSYQELHRSTGFPLATGEHLYDRSDVLPYLTTGTLAVVQTDPEWCGGVTELTKICALASTFGIPVVPHGHGLHSALHVVASQPPSVCPMTEYLFRTMPNRHHFELNPPTPEGGSLALPHKPGFGIELDESKIDSRELWQFPA